MLECRETLATSHFLFHLLFYNADEDRWSNQGCLLVPLRPSSTSEEQTVEWKHRVELLELQTEPFLSICSNMTRRREIKQNYPKKKTFLDFSRVTAFEPVPWNMENALTHCAWYNYPSDSANPGSDHLSFDFALTFQSHQEVDLF